MARRSLRPHLNQIRGWVRQGRTDAWIAHQLEVTVQQIEAFKRENELAPEAEGEVAGPAVDFDDEIDLRAEDDALIAAELEAEQAKAAEEAAAAAEAGEDEVSAEAEAEDEDENGGGPRGGWRGRRGRGGGGGGRGAVAADAAVAGAAAAVHGARPARARARSRARSTTARRATGCGSTPPSRTTPCTRSTGRATGPSRSPSRPTASSSAALATKTSSPEHFARVLAFDRVVQTRMATRTVPTAHGTAFFFDPHPNIWDRNLLALDSVDASFADLCREADEVQHDLPHRMLVFDGDA